jgi:hypothetical protein
MDELKYSFQIPIGDWSGDGHSICEYTYYKSNKPVEVVRDGYFLAKKNCPTLCPENFCRAYQDSKVDMSTYKMLIANYPGFEVDDTGIDLDSDDEVYFGAAEMLELTVRFLKIGDPDLVLEEITQPPMLAFYGHDSKKRHIGFIGYGTLGY